MVKGAYSDNLLKLENTHVLAVGLRASPFWVEHCEAGQFRL
jgi:hypothetical protein